MRPNTLPLLIVVLLIVSCVSTARFEERYNTWVGMTTAEVTDALGKPNKIINMPNGTIEYSYNLSISKKDPLPDTCILNFIISKGIVTGIKHEGNRCKRGLS